MQYSFSYRYTCIFIVFLVAAFVLLILNRNDETPEPLQISLEEGILRDNVSHAPISAAFNLTAGMKVSVSYQGHHKGQGHHQNESDMAVQVCRIPSLTLETDANKHAYRQLDPLRCSGEQLFYLRNGELSLNRSVLGGRRLERCEYRGIEWDNDRYHQETKTYVQKEEPFTVQILHDFYRVSCYIDRGQKTRGTPVQHAAKLYNAKENPQDNHLEGKLYQDGQLIPDQPDFDQFVVQIYTDNEIIERVKEIQPSEHAEQMNVLMFALDSMSHLSYQRKVPMTYKYIQETLGSTILNGYNIVGDATTAALIPILTGKKETELPDVRVGRGGHYVDIYPLIWNKFEQNGYVTLFAEDMPQFGTFQLRMNGFEERPVDHYMRPFWQAALRSDLHENSNTFCLGGAPEHKYTLDYIKQFMLKYKNIPKFAFGFIGELSHADNNPAQHIDQDLVNFLKMLKKNGALDNTLVVVMGDHGARYSKVRHTFQGKLEERLPMMSLAFPKRFKDKFPKAMENLKKNANRLTTPFDIHETLKDILDTRRIEKPLDYTTRGISLLTEVPLNRTCEAADIALHWCTCLQYEDVDVKDKTVSKVSRFLVKEINSMTEKVRGRCAELKEKEINDAKLVVPNEKVLRFLETDPSNKIVANFSKTINLDIVHYQLVITTSPNDAIYEATVQHTVAKDAFEIIGSVSRINMYNEQPACIVKSYPDLRKYCLCHE